MGTQKKIKDEILSCYLHASRRRLFGLPTLQGHQIKECKGTFETKGTSASDSDKDMKCLSHPPVHFKPICTHKFPVDFKPLPADFKPPAGMKPIAPISKEEFLKFMEK